MRRLRSPTYSSRVRFRRVRTRGTQTSPISSEPTRNLPARQSTDVAVAETEQPTTAVHLTIQPSRHTAPIPLQLYLYPRTSNLRIHVHSATRVTYQAITTPSFKRRAEEQSGGRRKRARRGSQVQDEEAAWRERNEEEYGEEVGERREAMQLEDDQSQPAYVVDMGLVRAFPNWEDDGRLRRVERPRVQVQMFQFGRLGVVLVVLFLGAVALIFIFTTSTPPPPPEPPSTNHLSLFTTALTLELSIMSLPRLILFGSATHEPQRWHGLPGLRPPDGPLHPEPIIFGPPTAEWFSNSSMYPKYKPWETTSAGVYVPEAYFLEDLQKVLRRTVADLREVADHGPGDFRFRDEEGREQWRWSTSAGEFVGTHREMRTFTPSVEERVTLQSTVAGVTTNISGVFATARPASVGYIFNQDPTLNTLETELEEALIKVARVHGSQVADLSALYPVVTEERVRSMLVRLEEMGMKMRNGGEWGSDSGRVECLYGGERVVDLAGEVEVIKRTVQGGTRGVDKEFVKKVRRVGEERVERSKSYAESVASYRASTSASKAAIPTPTPPCHIPPSPHLHPNNITFTTLLSILNTSANFHYDGADLPDPALPKYYNLIPYADALSNLSAVLQKLNHRVLQVRGLEVGGLEGRVRGAVGRLQDMSAFLDEIAVRRVEEMAGRAELGVRILLETERAQGFLREDIVAFTSSSSSDVAYFPALNDLLGNWTLAYKWFEREGASVRQTFHDRQFEFLARREEEEKIGEKNAEVIWTRWGIRDVRREPEGRERLCWRDGVGVVEDGGNWWGRKDGCGDAGGRGGYQ